MYEAKLKCFVCASYLLIETNRASTNRVLWSARRAIITAAQASPLFSRGSVSLEQNAFGQPPWRSALYLFVFNIYCRAVDGSSVVFCGALAG